MSDHHPEIDYIALLVETATAMREQHGDDHPRHAMWEAIASLLDRAADQHHLEVVDDLYFSDCEECPEGGDCDGHLRTCCWICNGIGEDGYATRVLYPCGEMRAAVAVAHTYIGAAS